MVMEAFEGYKDKFKVGFQYFSIAHRSRANTLEWFSILCFIKPNFAQYEIWGHSGDGYEIPLITSEKPPLNNKERLEVIKTMHAHAQFCMSGDHTLEATKHAIKVV